MTVGVVFAALVARLTILLPPQGWKEDHGQAETKEMRYFITIIIIFSIKN